MSEKIKILYIDDNPMDRQLVKDSLEREHSGFKLTEAKSETEFLQLIAKQKFDLVLTDFNIRGYEGLQVLDTIQQKQPETPVIIVTGTGSETVAVESMKRGAADYVIKTPDHIKKLPETIFKVLELKTLKQEKEKADELLQAKQHNLNAIMDNSTCGIVVLDSKGKILFINKQTELVFQRNANELIDTILGIPSDKNTGELAITKKNGETGVVEIKISDTIWENTPAQMNYPDAEHRGIRKK